MGPPRSGVGKQSASPPRQNRMLVQALFSHRSCRVQDLQHALLPVNLDLKNNKVNKHTEIAKKTNNIDSNIEYFTFETQTAFPGRTTGEYNLERLLFLVKKSNDSFIENICTFFSPYLLPV